MDQLKQGALPVSERVRAISPFLAMEVFERAAEMERRGRSVVHLEVGEPDWATPEVALQAGMRALEDGHTHYTPSTGRLELREAISEWYRRWYSLQISPRRVVVTLGSSSAMLLAFAVLLDTGNEVVLTDPHYPCYPKFVSFLGGRPVPVPVRELDNFQYDLSLVRRHLNPRTRALILNSPANPTGTVTEGQRMEALVGAVENQAVIVADEVYHGLVYKGRAHSILEYTSEAIVINGFSKLFAMTGWRLGYAIVPDRLVRFVQTLQQNLFISPPDFAQFAAVAALTRAEEEIERRRQAYDERRQLVLRHLNSMGLPVLAEPTGAFYVFVNIRRYSEDSLEFAFRLLEKAGVAVAPGIDFGAHGEGFIRISYASAPAQIEEGMQRLAAFLQRA